jgi:cyclophilin family peptidyl-prolyl cis-trans isomerase
MLTLSSLAVAQGNKKPTVEERKAKRVKQKRRADLRKTFRRIGIFALVFVAFLGISAWNDRDRGIGPLGEEYDEVRAFPTACGGTAPGVAELMNFEAPSLSTGTHATITTSCGTIEIELKLNSQAAKSFAFLSESGFYDGTVIHRIVEGFIIEGGDPTATGDGGAGYRINDEPSNGIVRGTVYLAAGDGPNRSSSQFGFSLNDTTALTDTTTVIGTVTEGMEVLDLISTIGTQLSPQGVRTQPVETIYIESIEISTQAG